jgi:hypothetical protein
MWIMQNWQALDQSPLLVRDVRSKTILMMKRLSAQIVTPERHNSTFREWKPLPDKGLLHCFHVMLETTDSTRLKLEMQRD